MFSTFGYTIELPARKSSILGPLLPQNALEKGGDASRHLFKLVLRLEGAVEAPKIDDFWPGSSIA